MSGAVEKIETKEKYIIYGDKDDHKFLEKSGMTKGSAEDATYLVCFGSEDEGQQAYDQQTDIIRPVLVIPADAIKSSTKESTVTAYRIRVFNEFYNDPDVSDLDTIVKELEADEKDLEKIIMINGPKDGGTEDGSEG